MGRQGSQILGRGAVPPVPASVASDDERWKLVVRIARSRQFAKSQQLKDILLYITQRSLSRSDVTIKEHEIGYEVLGRGTNFDPHEDNIVRVQVGRLRRRLDAYFAGEGKAESLRLAVPKGSYVPQFEPVPAAKTPPSAPVLESAGAVDGPRPGSVHRGRALALAALLAVLCGSCFLVGRSVRLAPAAAKQIRSSSADRLWAEMFGGAQPTNIVVSDTCLVMLQDILDTDIALEEYLSPRYPNNVLSRAKGAPLRSALELIISRQYTSLADLNIASALVDVGHRYSQVSARIRYVRHLNVREFKNGNFILLGSRRGIPWVQLFEPLLGFSMEEDGTTQRYYFRNKHPRHGEEAAWRQKLEGGNVVESYTDLALVPNLGASGHVMLLSGLTMHATEAAGELVAGPDFGRILSSLVPAGSTPPHYFEVLLRTRVIAGSSRGTEVVTTRILQPDSSVN
jgi:hypothetical protein